MNSYYVATGYPVSGSLVTSPLMRAELVRLATGFTKLPVLSGNANSAIVVGTDVLSKTSSLALVGNFTSAGGNALTLTTTGDTSLTLPTTGTCFTLTSSSTLSIKQITSPTISGTITGTYSLAGTVEFAQAIMATPTLTNPVMITRFSGDDTSGTYTLGGTVSLTAPTFRSLTTLTGGLIAFPGTQLSSSSNNVLDDYEEGNWTPSVGGSATYTTQVGRYVKIGKYVFVRCRLTINVLGTGSNVVISGLPFTSTLSNVFQAGTIVNTSSLSSSVVSMNATFTIFGPDIVLSSRTAASASSSNTPVMGNGTQINLAGWYECVN